MSKRQPRKIPEIDRLYVRRARQLMKDAALSNGSKKKITKQEWKDYRNYAKAKLERKKILAYKFYRIILLELPRKKPSRKYLANRRRRAAHLAWEQACILAGKLWVI